MIKILKIFFGSKKYVACGVWCISMSVVDGAGWGGAGAQP